LRQENYTSVQRFRYSLPPDDRLLEAFVNIKDSVVTLRLKDQHLARIDNARALEDGASLSLPDGSFLMVRLKGGTLTILHDDKLLISRDDWAIKHAFISGFVLGVLNLILGLAGALADAPSDAPATGMLASWTNVLNKMGGVVLSGPPLKLSPADFVAQPAPMGFLHVGYGALLLVAGLLWVARRSTSALLVALTAVIFASAATLRRVTISPESAGSDVVLALFLMLLLRFVCLVGIVEALRTTSRAGRMAQNLT
jgi:hypothetical protein